MWKVSHYRKLRKYVAERYRLFVDLGICVSCKGDAHPGRVRCLSCAEDINAKARTKYAEAKSSVALPRA
jgi:hypothetical protein